jgi:hypothetical protein
VQRLLLSVEIDIVGLQNFWRPHLDPDRLARKASKLFIGGVGSLALCHPAGHD